MVGYSYAKNKSKFRAIVLNLRSEEREQLPDAYRHRSSLSGGYYQTELEAGKAADK
jgi:hypothetical protein